MTTLQWARSHGDVDHTETITFPIHHADPPHQGAGTHSAGVSAAGGETSGFPNLKSLPDGTDLWSLVVGDDATIASGVAAGLEQLQEQPGRLASARLKALAELQAVLRSHSNGIDWDHPITVPAGDLVLVVQLAMQRLQ